MLMKVNILGKYPGEELKGMGHITPVGAQFCLKNGFCRLATVVLESMGVKLQLVSIIGNFFWSHFWPILNCFYLRYDPENEGQASTFTKFLHPDYSASNTNNDVCLLRLNTPLNFTNPKVGPIELNRFDDWDDKTDFTVTGWGTTSVSS